MLVHELLAYGRDEDVAVVDRKKEITYRALRQAVTVCRNNLYAAGVRRGDRIAIFSRKTVNYIVSYMAISSLGAIVVPINIQLSIRETAYILKSSGSTFLLTSRPFDWTAKEYTKEFIGTLKQLDIETCSIPAGAPPAPPLPAYFKACEPYIIIYTSGTTGSPKGAVLSHNNITCNARQVQEVLHITRNDKILCILPMYHCFCLCTGIMNPLLAGAKIVLFDSYTLKDVVKCIRDYELTVVYLVPSICTVLIQTATKKDLATVRYTILGGTTLPLHLIEVFEAKFGLSIIEGYGLSEASPVVAVNPPAKVKAGSIGLPLPGVKVRIVDEDGYDVPNGTAGQLIVQGKNVMQGYWHQPGATSETLRGGWLYTGDIAICDTDNYLHIVDRIKEMIISMGENIYPREIEEVLYQYPGIKEGAVIGIPDTVRGQVGCCYYTTTDNTEISQRDLKKFLQENLALFKVPKKYYKISEMPRMASGKIAKLALKDLYNRTLSDTSKK
ncbi:MAG: AMP-binding protein [Megasphaera sp.]|jgi:long-chain acyl-CoA synthetase|nr:AMP-binding protein [Megasphaera sp.]